MPPSPEIQDRQPLPPIQTAPQQGPSRPAQPPHHAREVRDHAPSMPSDHDMGDYIRTHPHSRGAPGPDGRPLPVMDPMGAGVAPPHVSAIHSPRRTPSGHESVRHLPPMSHLPPIQQQYDGGGHSHPHAHTSPPMHPHAGVPPERTRSHSSSRSRSNQGPPQAYHPGHIHPQQFPESLPPVQHVMHNSPPLSERERERSRRHDLHEISGSHNDPHASGRHQTPMAQMSPRAHPSDTRPSRMHAHQRMPTGPYMNRDEHQERLEYERERDWEREREQRERDRERDRLRDHARPTRDHARPTREISSSVHSPLSAHRPRQPTERGEFPEHHASARVREDSNYYHDKPAAAGYPIVSRSGSPGSGSGSGNGAGEGPSRPESRSQAYEQERRFRLRPVGQPGGGEEDFTHEEGRSQSRDHSGGGGGGGNYLLAEQSRLGIDSRKRVRNDMDVDSENDVNEGPGGSGGLYSTGRLQDDRTSKRYHREHAQRRSTDNHEDSRMGPS